MRVRTTDPQPVFQGDSKSGLKNLLISQFFGAFNDNAWKLIVTFLGIRSLELRLAGQAAEFQQQAQFQTTLTFCVLTLPLILFSLPAGYLADRISKRRVILCMKGLEVLLMLSAALSLLLIPGNAWIPLCLLGLMGAQSALFSPAKYGILPEVLPHEKLSRGNARLEMWTFLAIILGTASAGVLLDLSGTAVWIAGGSLCLFSWIGFVAAFGIPKVPAARADGGFAETLTEAWRAIRKERILGLTVSGLVFYWTIASLLGQDILVYARTTLGLSDSISGAPLAVFGLGVGIGSLAAGRLSRCNVEYGLIPLGAVLMAGGSLTMALWSPQLIGLFLCMLVLGIASGIMLVPLNALLQWKSPADRRGGVIALSNVFVFGGIFAGSMGASLLSSLGLNPQAVLLIAAAVILAGTAWAVRLLPDPLFRLCLILLTATLYRLKVVGRGNVPSEGGVLLVSNHVSMVDGLMLIASVDRPIRFIVEKEYFDHWFLNPFFKRMGAIPISTSQGPRIILKALRDAGRFLAQGEMVCIFPEGQMTRTGGLLPFQKGLEKILRGTEAQVVPAYLDRLWGSVFSREGGRFLKLPKRIPYRVTVAYGQPMPADSSREQVRQAVVELGNEAWNRRKPDVRPLAASFVRRARRNPFATAFADGIVGNRSRIRTLAASVIVARKLRPHWREQTHVGILLPPCVAGATVNIAAALCGRVSVNLNYTAGRQGLESAIRQAGLRNVVASRTFLERLGLQLPETALPIWIEDLKSSITARERLCGLAAAWLLPVGLLGKWCGRSGPTRVDDVASVIFSSGSTGEPKGVELTHFNVDSNLEAVSQVLSVTSRDRVLGILPLFHSFGYLSLWFAANKGLRMPMHANPLDAAVIGRLIQQHRITILLATPTFLQLYLRRCDPRQLGSLRLAISGAEKMPDRLAEAFEERFGIRLLEGYGATECSPTIAVNHLGFRSSGYFQRGAKRGFVGHPLPGVAVRIVDPETHAPLPTGVEGMLLVKGPNVMRGYLGRPDLTRAALRDGWYVTGDIALLDEDGFLRITDRLSRFSKIGGEMVPHGRVEDALQEALEAEEQVVAVTALHNPAKGESLAVLHTCSEESIREALGKLRDSGLPNLFVPRPHNCARVDQLPLLGSGKLNLAQIKRIAQERFSGPE